MRNLHKELLDNIFVAWERFDEGLKETPDPAICEAGGIRLTERLAYLAEVCLPRFDGDLVEIGAWAGYTTVELCKVARVYGRRVLVIDPWVENDSQFPVFLEATKEYKDVLDVYRMESQSQIAIDELKKRRLCFVYIDGLHTYEAVRSDIESTKHCQGIIACDDMSWNGGVRQAFFEARNKLQMRNALFREGYLLPT